MSERRLWTPDTSGPDGSELQLSALEAAAILGVHERTIRRAIARGALPATKRSGTWHISRNDLEHLHRSRGVRGRVPRSGAPPSLTILPREPAQPPFVAPIPRTPLIGRERDIASVRALLEDERAPLVTLTGPGGSGKTRLALAVAAALRDRFVDGTWFVDLSAIRDPNLVPGAIAQALELQQAAGERSIDRLGRYLRSRSLLLVLDNLEQVISVAPLVADLLLACPTLQVLATSRVPLHITAEHQFRVTPLDLPGLEHPPHRDEVEAAPATRLFRQAARKARSDFEIIDANAPAVAAICARLDGLPLAIELAAAQCGIHTPDTLLKRLDNRAAVLDQGPRDVPPRLRTMRDAIGWSYDLLDDSLQVRFRRLCVFNGGFSAQSADAVTSQPPLDSAALDAQLRALVDASLVVADPESSRFTLLETIREFGQDQLENRGEADSLREAHARWCLDLLTRAQPHWFTPAQTEWSDVVERDHPNLRAALTWLDASNRHDGLISLAGLMWPFWFVRHHWLEGMAWLEHALDASVGQHSLARIQVLIGAGCLHIMRGDEPAARALNEEALALYHELGCEGPNDSPLVGLALCANMRGDVAEGRRLNLEALAMLRAHAGTDPGALPMASVIILNMAWTLFHQGQADEAEPLAREALAMQRDLGYRWAAADTLLLHARLAEARGQHRRATACYHESLRLAVETRDLQITVANLDRITRFLAAAGDDDRVALLLGACARLHEIIADVPGVTYQSEITHIESLARTHLGDDTFDRLYRHGQAMPLDDVLAVGLETSVPSRQAPLPAAARRGITRREFEVLGLLAQGLTDQEIADTLFVGLRTVHTHVSHLLAKFEVSSRRDVVARARADHLLDGSFSPSAPT